MQDQHIMSAFDRDLEGIQRMIMQMGGLCEAAILNASEALANRDIELANSTRADDKAIDALEEQINQEAARIIAIRAPMGGDLRMILSVMKIAAALERIGDYAKNMAKRTLVLAEHQQINGTGRALQNMAREVGLMLKNVLDASLNQDVELAEDVRSRDRDIDQLYNGLFRELLTHMMEDPRKITAAMHLHFIAKNLERVGDHVTAIAEQTIYVISGELPDDNREKVSSVS